MFYCNLEVPQIFETPLEITSSSCPYENIEKFEVKRSQSIFKSEISQSDTNLDSFDHGCGSIDLQALLTEIFITNGRVLHHERVLCFFPEYLQH